MNIELLPEHIFNKILIHSLSIDECDIYYNLNLKLVSKYWYKKINTVKFWKEYSKEFSTHYGIQQVNMIIFIIIIKYY